MSTLHSGDYRETLEAVKKVMTDSRYLVCLKGRSLSSLCGCSNYFHPEDAYAVEAKYGYSPEEILSASFYNTRVEQFYDFYKNEMIADLGEIPEGMKALARLEEKGILKYIITRDVFSLAKRAGCKNVLEIHGNVFHNQCPHCKAEYPIEYIQQSKGVPKCSRCGTTIRPKMCLVGEMVDNDIVTRAAEELAKADTVLIMGCHMNDYLITTFLRYFNGEKVILLSQEEHYLDYKADLTLYGNPMDILADLGV